MHKSSRGVRHVPVAALEKVDTVKLRIAEYDKLKTRTQEKTGPSSSDVELDELLQKNDLMSATSRVTVLLWRALLEVFDAREEYNSMKENESKLLAKKMPSTLISETKL
jgi:hypothetical protein